MRIFFVIAFLCICHVSTAALLGLGDTPIPCTGGGEGDGWSDCGAEWCWGCIVDNIFLGLGEKYVLYRMGWTWKSVGGLGVFGLRCSIYSGVGVV